MGEAMSKSSDRKQSRNSKSARPGTTDTVTLERDTPGPGRGRTSAYDSRNLPVRPNTMTLAPNGSVRNGSSARDSKIHPIPENESDMDESDSK